MAGRSGVLAPRPGLGAAAMLLNTLLIPIMGVAVKKLAEMEVSTLEMLTWRALIVLALLLPFLTRAPHRAAIRAADIRAHAVHAIFAISTMACFYYALRTLPIATVTVINFSTPIFALLFARMLFGERVTPTGWIAVGLGFLGVVLVLRPDSSGIGADALVVLLGSLLAAGMNLAVRRMPARSSNFAVLFYLSAFGGLLYGALGGPGLEAPTADEFGLLLLLGTIALAVHTCVTLAYRFASSMLIGALDYLRIIWAVLIGYLLLAEQPDGYDLVGTGLIVASGWIVLRGQLGAVRVPAPRAR